MSITINSNKCVPDLLAEIKRFLIGNSSFEKINDAFSAHGGVHLTTSIPGLAADV